MKKTAKILLLAIFICALHVQGQSSAQLQIISSGFGENLSTGCPRLQVIDDMLYAPGPNGIMRHAKGAGSKWEAFAMQGVNVIDFRLSGNDIMAIIVPDEYSHRSDMDLRTVARLVKCSTSSNEFTDITPQEMEYTYKGEVMTNLSALAQHPIDGKSIMLMGHGGIIYSSDFGETWVKLSDYRATYNPHSFLGWHPQNPEILFLTSESNFYVGMVCRSIDGGKTWEQFSPDPNSESSCHDIAFDPDNADHLLISGEYAIYESFDCGETWRTALNDKVPDPILGYAYNIMYDSSDSSHSTIYSIGHANGESARYIVESTDKGSTWKQCMTYDFDEERNFIYDAALFDDKIWIYDYKDIVYWNISGNSGIDASVNNNPQTSVYYDLNGIRLNSLPPSGIVIEKQGSKSKVIVL